MPLKAIFVGNIFGGDDGIGPHLFSLLKDDPRLASVEMLELGVIGFDMLSYVGENDSLIIIDALHSEKDIGDVALLGEKDLTPTTLLVSQHDFGVGETAALLRNYRPRMGAIKVIGVKVFKIQPFQDRLSDELSFKLPKIKEEVVKLILESR